MMMNPVKEEPEFTEDETHDQLIASYDIVPVENSTFLAFNVCGLNRILDGRDWPEQCDISIRTDQKEMKIVTQNRHGEKPPMIFTTKQTNLDLQRCSYAVKLSRETGNAYFIALHSIHSLSLMMDEANNPNPPTKSSDSQNIFEDSYSMPHPSRNIHDQLRIEMKNHLYKPLKPAGKTPEQCRNFLVQLFTSVPQKRSLYHSIGQIEKKLNANDLKLATIEKPDPINLIDCPYWYLNKINLSEINNLELLDWKIEVFVRKVQVIRFQELASIFNVDAQKLLNILVNICYLIRGNWVIKSQLLYRFDVMHDIEQKQLRMKLLIAVREYILWFFATNKPLQAAELFGQQQKLFKQTSHDFEDILNRLTVRTGSHKTVEFVLPEDLNFISQHPGIAKKHHEKTRDLLTNKHQEHLALMKLAAREDDDTSAGAKITTDIILVSDDNSS